jgi:hypothetical protein
MALWSNRLLNDCRIVDNVISLLSSSGAIHTINSGNTRFSVAAGGYLALTDPSFVFTFRDSGVLPASTTDIAVLDNALAYVLNQDVTVYFSPDNPKTYDLSMDYALVEFSGPLTGVQAKGFFDYVGTIDPALWSGAGAGFTQIFPNFSSPLNNWLLFIKPAAPKSEFIAGLSTASAGAGATYAPLKNNGEPSLASAGVAFLFNDWVKYPNGNEYLGRLGITASSPLAQGLSAMRQQHLQAAAELLKAIDRGNVSAYLNHQFRCAD